MAFTTKALFLFALIVLATTTTDARKHKVTRLQFFMHDSMNVQNATAVQVVTPENSTSSFGSVIVLDNPLTALPERNSTLVGRAQGLSVVSSQEPGDFSLTMSFTIGFVSGPYNGSTISVSGRNSIMSAEREMPIVGGSGMFRLARGYCILRTHSFVPNVGVIGYNVTVMHYI